MQLARALQIQPKEVIAFTGGGGKTTAMFRLAAELAAEGKRVVTTTTTRIFAAQLQLAPQHRTVGDPAQALAETQAVLRETPHLLLTGATNREGKAFGIAPEFIAPLLALDEVDAILVEADGSRMRPLKAPADHEPVVPFVTTLLVPVVGIDAVGAPLDDEHVHRAERVAELLEVPPGTPLTAEHIARLVGHPRGGLKGKPAHARVVPLINKVEDAAQRDRAGTIADALLKMDAIDAVTLGAVRRAADPVVAVRTRVAAVILAAGGSTRMQGKVKQLLPWGQGTLVQNAVRTAERANVSEIVVVTGNHAAEVANQVEGTAARLVHNPDWATGRASSVRAGLAALSPKIAAAVFINADQPFLTPAVIDAVSERFAATLAPVVVPTYEGTRGSPVLFARELFGELAAQRGDHGGRELLVKHRARLERVEIADARAATDIDTPEEYAAARQRADLAQD